MHILDARRQRVDLVEVAFDARAFRAAASSARRGAAAEASPLARAGRAFFELGRRAGAASSIAPLQGPPPTAFRERRTGLLRTFRRELVIRFAPGTAAKTRAAVLRKWGLEVRRANVFVPDQITVFDKSRKREGGTLVDVANTCAELDEVIFATPNFVSEYRRQAASSIPRDQWHLLNRGIARGQRKGEDVDALEAWAITRGRPGVVVAILDDGVDVEHPDLRSRIWRNPDKQARDQVGRDFFLPDDHPDHFNPRPKKFRFPFDQMEGNDIHGTPCAGVAAAAGKRALGIAPRCRILPVKIFHADELAPDERVADAIRYAAGRADVLSCSWSGGTSPDVELALEDAQPLGRGGRGAAIFCATGNEASGVGFPASHPATIGVGASTDRATLAGYSNTGPGVDLVAPSSGGVLDIFTTDVSLAGRGFNVGRADQGGADGRHTNSFGGTSSATPLAAGVGALVLSANAGLTREEVRQILRATADKIGSGYGPNGHSRRFGHGRVNAARAVDAARNA